MAGAACIALAAIFLGLWRGNLYTQALDQYRPLYGHKLAYQAVALNDAVYGRSKQLSFDVNNIELENGQKLVGKVSVYGFGLNSVYFGDELEITGKLMPSRGSYQARMSYAEIKLVRHNPSLIGDTRRGFAAGLQNALPEPLASFALGLLVGQRATLPDDIKQSLLHVGLTHIIAVSGYNLTIMLRASRRLLAGQSKRLSFSLSYVLITIFILITGFSASIVRAAIVSSLSLLTSYYGRTIKPLLLLLLVAAGTALWNPVYLWSDAGWYLSFLAFGGVMILSPLLAARLPDKIRSSTLLMIGVESIAAEMTTLPYLLHTFGQMSFVGLLANVAVAVFIPLAMLLCAAAGIVGMFAAPLCSWFAWPAQAVLTYMLDVVGLLNRQPHVFTQGVYLSTRMAIELYGVVFAVWAILYFKKPVQSAILTDKNANILPVYERMHIV